MKTKQFKEDACPMCGGKLKDMVDPTHTWTGNPEIDNKWLFEICTKCKRIKGN